MNTAKEAITKYNDGKYDDAFALAEQGWAQFPTPVEGWNQAYNYAKSFFGKALGHQNFDEAKKWLNRLIDNNNNFAPVRRGSSVLNGPILL